MLFTVVIPTYNRADLLGEALQSVFSQNLRDFEVIVVDDGSADDLAFVVEKYSDRVRLLRQNNAGPSAARNRGIHESTGEYVAFLDSDDLWFPWTLDIYRTAVDRHEGPAFIAGCPRVFHDRHELDGLSGAPTELRPFPDYLQSGDMWRWFGASSFVIRRDVLVECEGFSSEMRYAEDADLALRLGTASGFVQVVSPATFGYRQGAGGQLTGEWKPQLPAAERILANEKNARYPGAAQRANERHRIISRHLRPVVLTLLREREFSAAWKLYRSILPWNLRLQKWKFVLGFFGQAAIYQALGKGNVTPK